LVVPEFRNLGITFEQGVHIGIGCEPQESHSIPWGDDKVRAKATDAFVVLGRTFNSTYALYDVVAHELMHSYLYRRIPYNGEGDNAAIHEGIADIFGHFIQSEITGHANGWWLSIELGGRNFFNHGCWGPANFFSGAHDRAQAIRHWFWLLTHGNNS
jgi:hypothetical protein